LAKEHGDELGPAGEALSGAFGVMLLHELGELGTREMLEQLIKEAGSLYDCLGPPCGLRIPRDGDQRAEVMSITIPK